MTDRDAATGDHIFDDELERALRGDEPVVLSAATTEELATARLLAGRLAWLRETPPGTRERVWASVQARRVARARRPFWQRLSGVGLLAAAAAIILALHGLFPRVQELSHLLRPALERGESRIAFVSERDGNPEIYAVRPDGSDLVRLTDHPAFDGDPAWSPDGQRIAFRSQRDGNSEIYVMNTDGTEIRRLTDHPADDLRPVWSPDGRQVAFISNRDGDLAVYVMDADGSRVRRLADGPARDGQLAWSCVR